MRPFDRSEEATAAGPASERLEAFHKALFDALVPSNGECLSVQGELVRARARLASELYRNGMGNYYGQPFDTGYYSRLVAFALDTLIANANGALDGGDVSYFAGVRDARMSDWTRASRLSELDEQEEPLTEAQQSEYEALDAHPGLRWEELANRAERCIANWCIANPKLVDRDGKPIEDRGVRDLGAVFEKPTTKPKCPLCGGKGFVQPDPTQFPERCVCLAKG